MIIHDYPVPARANPEVLRAPKIINSDNIVSPTKLTAESIANLARLQTPSSAEFAGMIKAVIESKNWSIPFYATLCNVSQLTIRNILRGAEVPNGPLARVIWMIFAADTNPVLLKDPVKIATWGRNYVVMPKKSNSNRVERKVIREYVSKLTKPITRRQIIENIREESGVIVDGDQVRHVAIDLGYKMKRGSRTNAVGFTNPTSIWLALDWSRSNSELAKATGLRVETIESKRIKLRLITKEKLIKIFADAGRDLIAVEALLRCHRKSLRNPIVKPRAPVPPSACS